VNARLVKPEIRLVQAEQSQPALAPDGFDHCHHERCECWHQQEDEGRPDIQEKDHRPPEEDERPPEDEASVKDRVHRQGACCLASVRRPTVAHKGAELLDWHRQEEVRRRQVLLLAAAVQAPRPLLDQQPQRHRARDLCQQRLAVVARSQALQAGSGDVGAPPLRWEELYQFSRPLLRVSFRYGIHCNPGRCGCCGASVERSQRTGP